MITKIGITAGDIWQTLDKKGKLNMEDIVREIDKPRDLVLMSIGWMAREGHIILEDSGDSHLVSLRK